MARSADAQTRRNVTDALRTAKQCLNNAHRWTQEERRPEMAKYAKDEKVQAMLERRRAQELATGARAVITLTEKQVGALSNMRFEGLHYIIASSNWLEFRPAQLERWDQVLKAIKVLRPSTRSSIQGLWMKLRRRANKVSEESWKL